MPVFTDQLDTVQVNIAQGIRNIFDKSVRHLQNYVAPDAPAQMTDEEMLTADEYREIDDLMLRAELEEQDDALAAEVEDAIAQATLDTDKLMQQYSEQVYDKKILRRIERLKNKSK